MIESRDCDIQKGNSFTNYALDLAIVREIFFVKVSLVFKSLRTEELVKVSECVAKSTVLEIGETFIHLARLESPFEIGCNHCDTI